MRYVIWCDACGDREVLHRGDLCGRCTAPDDAAALAERAPLTMAPPWGVRVLRWVTRRWGLA